MNGAFSEWLTGDALFVLKGLRIRWQANRLRPLSHRHRWRFPSWSVMQIMIYMCQRSMSKSGVPSNGTARDTYAGSKSCQTASLFRALPIIRYWRDVDGLQWQPHGLASNPLLRAWCRYILYTIIFFKRFFSSLNSRRFYSA